MVYLLPAASYKTNNMSENDKLILVNLYDEEVGSGSKLEVHQKSLLHRAFSVYVVNDGKMLLQKRNPNKYHSGDLWANACCSHPRRGEELECAVHRRMVEELGFDCEVKELFDFIYRTDFGTGIYEYEYDHVFLAEYSGKIEVNYEEATEIKWVDLKELKDDLVSNPERYSSWFLISAHKVIKHVEGTR